MASGKTDTKKKRWSEISYLLPTKAGWEKLFSFSVTSGDASKQEETSEQPTKVVKPVRRSFAEALAGYKNDSVSSDDEPTPAKTRKGLAKHPKDKTKKEKKSKGKSIPV